VKIKYCYIIFILIFSTGNLYSQENEETTDKKEETKEKEKVETQKNEELKVVTEEVAKKKKRKERRVVPYEPLAPARAAFYSAVLPGLGQAYTKKYWKIPIVYAAIGSGIYFYLQNNDRYNLFRDEFKRRLAGITDGELSQFSEDQLVDLQDRFRRDQEFSLLLTVAAYLLNIVDANVTAHLQQYNINEDLSFKPKVDLNQFNTGLNYGISFNYSF